MDTVDRGIFAVLDADRQSNTAGHLGALGVTGIHHGIAPKGAPLPYVRFQQLAAPLSPTMGDDGVDTIAAVYMILAVTEGDDQLPGNAIANRVKQLLHKKPLDVSPASHMRTLIDRNLDLPDHGEGIQLQQIGANYRVWVYE